MAKAKATAAAGTLIAAAWLGAPGALAAAKNHPPNVHDQNFDVDEDGTLKGELHATDDDPDDNVTFAMNKAPQNGSAAIAADGKLTYTPNKDWHGKDVVLFDVSDGKSKVTKKAIINVAAVNDPPVAGPAVDLSGLEDKPVKGQVTATDVDKDQLTFSLGTSPAAGSVDVDERTGKFTYTPKENSSGTFKFSVKASDANAVEVSMPVTVAITPVNDAPTCKEGSEKGHEDDPLTGKLVVNDVDKGDTLTLSVGTPAAAHGKVDVDSAKRTFTYVGAQDWHGDDAFTYVVTDAAGASAHCRVEIELTNVNDSPVATKGTDIAGDEDTPIKGKITAKDADGDEMYFELGKLEPKHGEVDFDRANGSFVYTAEPNFNGTDKFTVDVGDTSASSTATVNVTVKPVNDAPTAAGQDDAVDEDAVLQGKLKAADVDKDALTFSLAPGKGPKNGVVEIKGDGAFSYKPKPNENGDDAFTFEVSDGKAKALAQVQVKVRPVNDAPTTGDVKVTTHEDGQARGVVLGNDIDRDRLTWSIAKQGSKGEAVIEERNGSFTYVPKENENGADSFTVEVSDGTASATSTVSVTINAVNDAPVASAAESKGNEDAPIKGKVGASDVDKDALTYKVVGAARSGKVEMEESSGAYTYTPNADFHGDDAFRYEVSDGKLRAQASVKLTVAPVNDAPVVKPLAMTTQEDRAVSAAVVASDVDKNKLTWSAGKPAAKGKVAVDAATGKVTYTPNQDENGDDAFTIMVSDGTASTEAQVSVAIAPVNDAPTTVAQSGSGKEDEPIKGTFTGADVDKDALSFAAITQPKHGKIEIDRATGAYTYTPAKDENGEDGFKLEVSDGKLRAQAEVKLTVAAVNDAPVVKPLALATQEDHAVSGAVIASDVDKDKLTWSEAKAPAKGKVVVDASTGKVTYTPNLDENGDDAFTIAVSDGAASTAAQVTVAIAPVNDAPTTVAQSGSGKEDEPIKGTFTGADVDKDPLSFTALTQPKRGKIEIDRSTGAYTYTPTKDENGDDGFKLEVSDGKLRAQADVKLAIAAVNDAPVPKDLAMKGTEDRELSGKVLATDVDKDALTFRVKTAPKKGRAFVDDATGAVRYAPLKDVNGSDAFVVEVSDGFASADANVSVDVAAAPDAPLVDARALEVDEDTAGALKLGATDADGDNVSFKIVTQGKLGVAEIQGDGATLRYTPKPDAHGEDEVVVDASDGPSRTRAVIPVRIAAKNDSPTVDAIKAEILEEAPVVLAVNARDKDGDPVKLVVAPAKVPGAELVQLSGALLKVQPAKDFVGDIDLTITPSDASGPGAAAPVKISVVNVNDVPTAKDLTLYAQPGKAVTGSIDAADVDAGDELTCSVAVPPKQGTVVVDDPRTGRFTYTANAAATAGGFLNAAGDADNFRIRVKDKAGAGVFATVHVSFGAAPAATVKPAAPTTKKPAASSPKS